MAVFIDLEFKEFIFVPYPQLSMVENLEFNITVWHTQFVIYKTMAVSQSKFDRQVYCAFIALNL
jgi:hypothetical protein